MDEDSSSSLFNCMNLRKICGRKSDKVGGSSTSGGGGGGGSSEDDVQVVVFEENNDGVGVVDLVVDNVVENEDEEISRSYEAPKYNPDSQIDYKCFLVPEMSKIVNSLYYWGKIDRYKAEELLEGKPEGSFLLRDSVQDEYVFSVSFRRYNRSLHTRIEESDHKFSFDCHDPGVYSNPSIVRLLDRYKDPMNCMFFEPVCVKPVTRTHVFPLQDLARSVICDSVTYSTVNSLPLPKSLKSFLKEYHYKHKVRVRYMNDN